MFHGRMQIPIVIGKGSGFQPKPSGRRPCGDQMAVYGPGAMWSNPTERIGPECRMGMTSPHPSVRFRPTRARTVSWMGLEMSWNGWPTGMRNATSRRLLNGTRRARIMGYFGYFGGEDMRPREPIFGSPAQAKWFRIFAMKQSDFAVRVRSCPEGGNHSEPTGYQSSRERETRPQVY